MDHDVTFDADVCIVGSGLGGWTIADELRDTSLRLVMVESGGIRHEDSTRSLNVIEDVGVPTLNRRGRVLGGTSTSWFGRCVPLDPIDFERRSWVDHSGWPFDRGELEPFLLRGAARLGARARTGRGLEGWPADPPRFAPELLTDAWWEATDPVDSGRRLLESAQRNLELLVHATVTRLTVDDSSGRIDSVEVACAPGQKVTIHARAVVLCAGGIENARILLCSNRQRPGGLGNEHDVVGRYLMDHPRDPRLAARFHRDDAPRVHRVLGPHKLTGGSGRRHEFSRGVALSVARQRADGLLNCAALPDQIYAWRDPAGALLRLARRESDSLIDDLGILLADPSASIGVVRSALSGQKVRRAFDAIGLLIVSEQAPDPLSRVSLSAEVDSLGLPIARVDWRVGAQELDSQAFLARQIAAEFGRIGLARVQLEDWVLDDAHAGAEMVDGCHPMGTTRMSTDPRSGVVDADCQVHGISGLYVGGSSVFPTGGHANPTLTLVALATRLADHLERELVQPPVSLTGTGPVTEAGEAAVAGTAAVASSA